MLKWCPTDMICDTILETYSILLQQATPFKTSILSISPRNMQVVTTEPFDALRANWAIVANEQELQALRASATL